MGRKKKYSIQPHQIAVIVQLLPLQLFNRIRISMSTFRSFPIYISCSCSDCFFFFFGFDWNSHHEKWHAFHTLISRCPKQSRNAFSSCRHESGGVNVQLAGCRIRETEESESRTQFSQTASGIDRLLLQGSPRCMCRHTHVKNQSHTGKNIDTQVAHTCARSYWHT